MQGNLNFSPMPSSHARRELEPLPELAGVDRMGIDVETDLRPNHLRQLSGLSYRLPDGRRGYVSVRHPESVNHDEGAVRRWLQAGLRGKRLVCASAKHECYVLQNFGLDPEALGVEWRDVFFAAALLNEHRYKINLDLLAQEELGRGKLDLPGTDTWPIHERPAHEVEAYAVEDACLAWELDERYTPRLYNEGLDRVMRFENDLVYSTVEMERNGAPLDVGLLVRWNREVTAELEARVLRIHRETGLNVDPDKRSHLERLFAHLSLTSPALTPTGEPCFDEEALEAVEHPVVRLALEARQLSSLLSKYLKPYLAAVEPSGTLRYQLHQLRGDEGGTVTGRYSSSHVNIQQVQEAAKQPALLQRWPVRRLFIAPPGEAWVSSDASQIEYRIFAHYAAELGMPRLADAYRADPKVDFHALVVEWTGLQRGFAKNTNFCKLFGGGPSKIVFTVNKGIKDRAKKLTEADGLRLVRKYDHEFPEAAEVMAYVTRVAERRGFVRTLMGRRRRYKPGDRYYSALNAICQGGAAETAKTKVLETHRARKRLGIKPRFVVHDEADGTSANPDIKREFDELLNQQSLPWRVPILWNTGTGGTWEEAH